MPQPKKPKNINPNADLSAVIKAIEGKYGKGMVHSGSETQPVYKLPFRAPNMNYATEGGVGFGRVASFYGDPATGKTRNVYELIAQLQQLPGSLEKISLPRIAYHTAKLDDTDLSDELRVKHQAIVAWLEEELAWVRKEFPNGGDAVFYNAEQQFDPIYAKRIGIDTDRVLIVDSTVIEEICEMLQALLPHYCMHVIDSTSYAASNLQLKEEIGKSLYAVDARQWKSSLKPALAHFDNSRNIAVLIHQMSTNMRTGGQDPNSTKFMRFASSLSIKFMRGAFLWNVDGVLVDTKPPGSDEASMAGMAEPDGVEVFAKVEKARTCRPHRVAGMQFRYKGKVGYVSEHELASSGIYQEVIRKSGSWFAVDGEEKNLGQGLKVVYARLLEDQSLRDRIMARVMDYTDE